jgi:hypothetical protein
MKTNLSSQEFLLGVRDELPILVGVVPFGMIYGILALSAGVDAAAAQAMSAIIFAGSAQFMTVQLAGISAPAAVMIITGFVINLRHALYSASVAPYVRHHPQHGRASWPIYSPTRPTRSPSPTTGRRATSANGTGISSERGWRCGPRGRSARRWESFSGRKCRPVGGWSSLWL